MANHTFSVFAVDTAGNADPPAELPFTMQVRRSGCRSGANPPPTASARTSEVFPATGSAPRPRMDGSLGRRRRHGTHSFGLRRAPSRRRAVYQARDRVLDPLDLDQPSDGRRSCVLTQLAPTAHHPQRGREPIWPDATTVARSTRTRRTAHVRRAHRDLDPIRHAVRNRSSGCSWQVQSGLSVELGSALGELIAGRDHRSRPRRGWSH